MDPIDAFLTALTGGSVTFTPVAGAFTLLVVAFVAWLLWARIARTPFLRPRPTRHAPRVDAVARVYSALEAPRLSDVALLWRQHLVTTLEQTAGLPWERIGLLAAPSSGLDPAIATSLRRLGRALTLNQHEFEREEAERDASVIDTGRSFPPDARMVRRLTELTRRTAELVARLESDAHERSLRPLSAPAGVRAASPSPVGAVS
ncbi:MAG: hypothetical protein L3K23_03655 [Thermoplasmata archaeon]|nr:hypothetical protein [Thermoplasmata archaeon]